jgi:hypothetical protein
MQFFNNAMEGAILGLPLLVIASLQNISNA